MEIDLDSISVLAEKMMSRMTPKMMLMTLSIVCLAASMPIDAIIREKKEEEQLHALQGMCFALLMYMKTNGCDVVEMEEQIRKELNIDQRTQEAMLDKAFDEIFQNHEGAIHEC